MISMVVTWIAGTVAGAEPASRTIQYKATDAEFLNPERGFYRFRDLVNPQGFQLVRAAGQTLIYGRVLANEFRDRPLSQSFLDRIQAGFDAARLHGLKVKFRLAYNADIGEPDAPKEIVLGHIQQLQPVWERNKDVLYHMDAGFIGAWGEWHSSTNGLDNPTDRRDILFSILDALPADRMVSVRTPHFKREIFGGSPSAEDVVVDAANAFDGSRIARVGHVNDCFLSSSNDVGTYINPGGLWPLERELDYVGGESLYVPFGGETCAVHPRNASVAAVAEMQRLHIDYLNLDWQPDVVQRWKDEGSFDEIQRRLGYRFELSSATIPHAVRPGGRLPLEISLKNVGFGELVNPRPVEVVLRNNQTGELDAAQLAVDPRHWAGGTAATVVTNLVIPRDLAEGTYSLGLALRDADPNLQDDVRYAIRFANDQVWDAISGVNWLDSMLRVADDAGGDLYKASDVFRELSGPESSAILGDFDKDGDCDASDFGQLAAALRTMSNDPNFDVDGDGIVSAADRVDLISRVKLTFMGDANLDGRFDTTDLVAVFSAGKYNLDAPAGWSTGDWNGDGVFDSGDLVAAFAEGAYEREPNEIRSRPVPEPIVCCHPITWLLLLPVRWCTYARR